MCLPSPSLLCDFLLHRVFGTRMVRQVYSVAALAMGLPVMGVPCRASVRLGVDEAFACASFPPRDGGR